MNESVLSRRQAQGTRTTIQNIEAGAMTRHCERDDDRTAWPSLGGGWTSEDCTYYIQHNRDNNCLQLARETDSLGWECLLEGRVSQQWLSLARADLSETSNPMSPESWTRCFIDRLLQVTHQQRSYRNYKVHFCKRRSNRKRA